MLKEDAENDSHGGEEVGDGEDSVQGEPIKVKAREISRKTGIPSLCPTKHRRDVSAARSNLTQESGYYTSVEAGLVLSNNNLRLERELGIFVAERRFPKMKFTVG